MTDHVATVTLEIRANDQEEADRISRAAGRSDFVGVYLRSLDRRDDGRLVRVVEDHGHRVKVENVKTERRTFLKLPLKGWHVEGRLASGEVRDGG